MSEAPPPKRRWARHAVAALAGIVFVEAAAFGLYWVRRGQPMSPGALAETRAEIAARELGEVTLPQADREDTHAKWATHPYVGYVLDPTVESWLTPDGTSVWGADDVPPALGPERYVVGLFGGSVAFLMGSDHHEALRDALQPLAPGRQVVLVVAATPSWKQPQSLFSLEWLALRGYAFDLVIELDGFNEIAGAGANHQYHGVHTAYPYNWRAFMASSAEGPDYLAAAGEATLLSEARRGRARWMNDSGLGWSPTANLVWWTLDERDAARLGALLERLATLSSRDHQSYGQRGPAEDFGDHARDLGPLVRELASTWARSNQRMAEQATRDGAAFALFLQPNQYVPESKPFTDDEEAETRVSDSLARVVPAGYPALQAEGARLEREHGVAFEDLTGIYRETRERVYEDWCCHVNARGNALLIEAIAARLTARAISSPGP
ncbi:MAG: hypothetical protein RLP09_32625 [Sandaracinaceae bacterium]